MKFGVVLDEVFKRHRPAFRHPERPARIDALLEGLHDWDRWESLAVVPPQKARREWILKVHEEEYIQIVERTARYSRYQLDLDTYASPDSFETALFATGSVIQLVKDVLESRIASGIALVRPPGHHAERDRSAGFCIFNNVAVAAEWALCEPGISKVAIVDYDVHHGNGTQRFFYRRSNVLYVSLHQYPLYPGTGSFSEQGQGEGRGFTVNLPLHQGWGDSFYRNLCNDFVVPVLEQFGPDLILVSVGYDGHRDDPLARMELTEEGYGEMAGLLSLAARRLCNGRIVYVLEGGYEPDALVKSVRATIANTIEPDCHRIRETNAGEYRTYRKEVQRMLRDWWRV